MPSGSGYIAGWERDSLRSWRKTPRSRGTKGNQRIPEGALNEEAHRL